VGGCVSIGHLTWRRKNIGELIYFVNPEIAIVLSGRRAGTNYDPNGSMDRLEGQQKYGDSSKPLV